MRRNIYYETMRYLINNCIRNYYDISVVYGGSCTMSSLDLEKIATGKRPDLICEAYSALLIISSVCL